MAMNIDQIPDLLAELRDAAPEESVHYFLQFEEYWDRKLWHELTSTLLEYFERPESVSQRLQLFEKFIKAFETKINQLKLVTLGLSAASQISADEERLRFCKALVEEVNKPSSQDAYVYATIAVASIQLQLNDLHTARKSLDSCEAILDTFDSVENIVHASFYRVNADYYSKKQDFAAYYKNALLFLACIDIDTDLSSDERRQRAHDLSVAALVSSTIYNFGELLLHPILNSLTGTEHAWLRELLFSFNRGDLGAYSILERDLDKNELLREHKAFLYTKISLAALTETVFRRPPHNRTMTFKAISDETRVPPQEIEHLIMKALSLGLLKGKIDQVAEVARINWVQPKVLDKGQVEGMRTRLKDWDASVNSLGNWIEGVGKDVWAA